MNPTTIEALRKERDEWVANYNEADARARAAEAEVRRLREVLAQIRHQTRYRPGAWAHRWADAALRTTAATPKEPT